MNNLKLYVMALYAVKPDPEFMEVVEQAEGRIEYRLHHRDGEMGLSSPIGLAAHVELAESSDEAKQMGLDVALDIWPRTDGWIGHTAVVQARSLQEALREAFGSTFGCLLWAEETESGEASGLLM